MFRNFVKKLYIGKSKLKFIQRNYEIADNSLVEALGYPLIIPGGSQYLPDYFIPGYFDEQSQTFRRLSFENRHPVNLYITGIPKGVLSIDSWKLTDAIWSSYYEDDYRGYLFQIQDSDKRLKFTWEEDI